MDADLNCTMYNEHLIASSHQIGDYLVTMSNVFFFFFRTVI